MAIKDWTSVYPAGGIDTNAEQPTIVQFTDKTRASQINSMRDAVQALEEEVGSDLIESGSLRFSTQELEATASSLQSSVTNLEASRSFIDLDDVPSSYAGVDGYLVKVDGASLIFTSSNDLTASTFLDLKDTPSTFAGSDGYLVKVDGTSLVFTSSADLGGGTTSPLTDKGDIYTYDTDNQRLGTGSDGQVLKVNSATSTGLEWADETAVPVEDDGTQIVAAPTALNFTGDGVTVTDVGGEATIAIPGYSSPLTTKGDLATYGTDDARLPVGSDGQVLKANSLEAEGLSWEDDRALLGARIPKERTEIINGGPSSPQTTTSATFASLPGLTDVAFNVSNAGKFRLICTFEADITSTSPTSAVFRVIIDGGEATEQTLQDDELLTVAVPYIGAVTRRTAVLETNLAVGAHTATIQFARISGSSTVQLSTTERCQIVAELVSTDTEGEALEIVNGGPSSSQSISTSTYTSIPGLTDIPFRVNTSGVFELLFSGEFGVSSNGGFAYGEFRIIIDDGEDHEQILDKSSITTSAVNIVGAPKYFTVAFDANLSAGNHTISIEWKRGSGNRNITLDTSQRIQVYATLISDANGDRRFINILPPNLSTFNSTSATFAPVPGSTNISFNVETSGSYNVMFYQYAYVQSFTNIATGMFRFVFDEGEANEETIQDDELFSITCYGNGIAYRSTAVFSKTLTSGTHTVTVEFARKAGSVTIYGRTATDNLFATLVGGTTGNPVSIPLSTKGDLVTYDTVPNRLPVGTDGQSLIADSSEATGLVWGYPSLYPLDVLNKVPTITDTKSTAGYASIENCSGSVVVPVAGTYLVTANWESYGSGGAATSYYRCVFDLGLGTEAEAGGISDLSWYISPSLASVRTYRSAQDLVSLTAKTYTVHFQWYVVAGTIAADTQSNFRVTAIRVSD